MFKQGCVVAAAACLTGAAAGDIINVPSDYPTIQAAIDASVDGDEVVVADGVYTGPGNRDVDFAGKLITVRSANGPQKCIIDAEAAYPNPHRAFHFHSGETSAAVVEGFTITGGELGYFVGTDAGAGIRCDGSSPTVRNCIITGNFAGAHAVAYGGGIYSAGGSPAIVDCTISDNVALSGVSIGYGGGVYAQGGSLSIVNCTVAGNSAGGFNGGGGGGVASSGAELVLINCVVSENSGAWGVGGVFCVGAKTTLINCTISENSNFTAGPIPDGVAGYGGNLTVANCIVWSNAQVQIGGDSATTVSHSDVQGGWSGPGSNNIDEDPLFVDPVAADYRLQAGSPCIDAGHNWAIAGLADADLDGNPRFADGPAQDAGCGVPVIVDMGAYEFQGDPFPVMLGDLDGDGAVNVLDFLDLLAAWGVCVDECCLPDLDLDANVGVTDLLLLLGNWG